MIDRNIPKINWFAAAIGFGVDLLFTQVVGLIVVSIVLSLQGVYLTADDTLPSDLQLIYQVIGVVGALVGGMAAGYLARHHGSLHGLLGSLIGLSALLCAMPLLGSVALNIGDVGFIVLNLVAAGYGGGLGERWRHRREEGDGGQSPR